MPSLSSPLASSISTSASWRPLKTDPPLLSSLPVFHFFGGHPPPVILHPTLHLEFAISSPTFRRDGHVHCSQDLVLARWGNDPDKRRTGGGQILKTFAGEGFSGCINSFENFLIYFLLSFPASSQWQYGSLSNCLFFSHLFLSELLEMP